MVCLCDIEKLSYDKGGRSLGGGKKEEEKGGQEEWLGNTRVLDEEVVVVGDE